MRRATLRSCSTRSRSRACCSISSRNGVTMSALHSSAILPSETRLMTMSGVDHCLPVGATPNSGPRSWMARIVRRLHHVAVGCLVLDDVANVGQRGGVRGGPVYVTFAPGNLAWKQAGIDEVV